MTAEIAIANRSAVALAADSAITVGEERVWKTSNKLFSLSPYNDIGIMIYGAGAFIGYPWETVIKLFRKSCRVRFNTVDDCRSSFIDFLQTPEFTDDLMQEVSASSLILSLLSTLSNKLKTDSALEFRKELSKRIDLLEDELNGKDDISFVSLGAFSERYGPRILEFAKEEFNRHITAKLHKRLVSVTRYVFTKKGFESGYETGIVFAGFGSKEMFPVIRHCIVDGMDNGYLRHWDGEQSLNFNTDIKLRGTITPFAQRDMTQLFIEGLSTDYRVWMFKVISELLEAKTSDMISRWVPPAQQIVEKNLQKQENKKIVDGLQSEFKEYRESHAIDPIMRVVSNLPKEDMAQMAEALVELTSLKRKVGSILQSVSGPVDVAIISKGDGFVWVKRKNYFDVELNRDFLYRKYGDRTQESTDAPEVDDSDSVFVW